MIVYVDMEHDNLQARPPMWQKSLAGLAAVYREAARPVLGICAATR